MVWLNLLEFKNEYAYFINYMVKYCPYKKDNNEAVKENLDFDRAKSQGL